MPALLLALAVLLLAPAAARGEVVVEGRGWGHGIGLSQYGAHGYARFEDRDFRWILGHYYTGTSVGDAPATRIRVLLRRAGEQTACGATRARAANGRRVRLSVRRRYRFSPASGRIRVTDASTGRTRARLRAPVRVTGRGGVTCLLGTAENGRRDGTYRGAMVMHLDGRAVLAVNDVSPRHYLYGVVPAEMPTDWPLEAVKAQSVAARSYAYRSLRPGSVYDVFADTRSQMYGGVLSETPAGNRAVAETGNLVVRDGAGIAQTFFFSTSGGRTAAVEEVWRSDPIAYLKSVEDPYDHISPYHTWEARLSEGDAQRKLRSVLSGELEAVEVASTTPSGRAATVKVVGTRGERTVDAATIRTLLGLRSTWFELR